MAELEFLSGYRVPLVKRPAIEKRTRQLLLDEINSEWRSTSEILNAIKKNKHIYLDMEWVMHILLDGLLKEGKVGQATFYGSISSWWNNKPLFCPKCGTWEVNQFFTDSGALIHNHCANCHKWGGFESRLVDYDRLYTLNDLQEMCREKGLQTSGDKKALIRRLFS